jgi:two-component system cell cycle sensor histidine kinase/response regulator CckA
VADKGRPIADGTGIDEPGDERRDAMPNGGTLTITTDNVSIPENGLTVRPPVPGQYVMLAARDTGTGVPEDIKAKIFDPFFTTKELGKGTGLGLATVFGVVRQSGGYVYVDSTPGDGAAFTSTCRAHWSHRIDFRIRRKRP